MLQEIMSDIYGNDSNNLIQNYAIIPGSKDAIRRAVDLEKFDVIEVIMNACCDQFRGDFVSLISRNMREDEAVEMAFEVPEEQLREDVMLLAAILPPESNLRVSIIQYYNQNHPDHLLNETRINKLTELKLLLSQEPCFQDDIFSEDKAIYSLIQNNRIQDLSMAYEAKIRGERSQSALKPALLGLDSSLFSNILDTLFSNSNLSEDQQIAFSKVMNDFFTAEKEVLRALIENKDQALKAQTESTSSASQASSQSNQTPSTSIENSTNTASAEPAKVSGLKRSHGEMEK